MQHKASTLVISHHESSHCVELLLRAEILLWNILCCSGADETSDWAHSIIQSLFHVVGVQLCLLCWAAFAAFFFVQSAPGAPEPQHRASLLSLSRWLWCCCPDRWLQSRFHSPPWTHRRPLSTRWRVSFSCSVPSCTFEKNIYCLIAPCGKPHMCIRCHAEEHLVLWCL